MSMVFGISSQILKAVQFPKLITPSHLQRKNIEIKLYLKSNCVKVCSRFLLIFIFAMYLCFILNQYIFRVDSLPKHHDMTDAVPVQLDSQFMSPGRVLKEINPPDPAAAATSPDNVPKQPLDFRFSVSQLPSWAQKRVSSEKQELLQQAKTWKHGY